ncbi:unnamed protein product [Peniophora sp. CBMAI 1063]|nr:unnamed protein product [Peniophora sp. CBMAI 1063]
MVLSKEMRRDIVRWTQEGRTRKEVAQLAKCHLEAVQTILRLWRETGNVDNPHALSRGGTRILNTIHRNCIRALHAQNPTRYLHEYQDAWWEVHGIDVSIATLCRGMAPMKYSHKQKSPAAFEQSQKAASLSISRVGFPTYCKAKAQIYVTNTG